MPPQKQKILVSLDKLQEISKTQIFPMLKILHEIGDYYLKPGNDYQFRSNNGVLLIKYNKNKRQNNDDEKARVRNTISYKIWFNNRPTKINENGIYVQTANIYLRDDDYTGEIIGHEVLELKNKNMTLDEKIKRDKNGKTKKDAENTLIKSYIHGIEKIPITNLETLSINLADMLINSDFKDEKSVFETYKCLFPKAEYKFK